jgi:hypothetical protein
MGIIGLVMSNQHKKFFDEFLDFEAKKGLFDLRVKQLNIWDHLRYKVYYDLLGSNVSKDQIRNPKKKLNHRRFLRLFFSIFSFLFFILFFLPRRNYDLMIIGDGASTNNNFDPIIDQYSNSNRILVFDISNKYSPYKKEKYADYININFLVLFRSLLKNILHFSKEEDGTFIEISKLLKLKFEVDFDSNSLKKDFIQRSYVDYLFYSIFLKRVKLKKILLCDNGSSKGIFDAAILHSVKVFDLQHAIVSGYNILYQYKKSISSKSIVKPSSILTFGSYWDDKFSLPVDRNPVGYPLFELKKSLSKGITTSEFTELKKEKTFLVISSMHSGKDLEKLVLDLATKLSDFHFIYKLRPNEYSFWKEVYSSDLISMKNIHVVDTDKYHLYDLFKISNYQIGINSTAILEGMAFGVKTFILKKGHYLAMTPLIESHYGSLISTAAEIIYNLEIEANKRPNYQDLFSDNSLQNIGRCLSLKI